VFKRHSKKSLKDKILKNKYAVLTDKLHT
jgi:hypothetical protein